jgi:hypothetical protein
MNITYIWITSPERYETMETHFEQNNMPFMRIWIAKRRSKAWFLRQIGPSGAKPQCTLPATRFRDILLPAQPLALIL